jgi:hypothetical protein
MTFLRVKHGFHDVAALAHACMYSRFRVYRAFQFVALGIRPQVE